MPSKQDSDQERLTDSWLFRLANKPNSSEIVFTYVWLIVWVTVALTLMVEHLIF